MICWTMMILLLGYFGTSYLDNIVYQNEINFLPFRNIKNNLSLLNILYLIIDNILTSFNLTFTIFLTIHLPLTILNIYFFA